jgi:predicted PurR-regulated permease PerM
MWAWAVRLFPKDARPAVEAVGATGWRVLGGYIRGVASVATFDAVCIGLGLAILGVPLVLPLAVLTFVGAFLPIVGAYVAGLAVVLVALVGNGVGTALIMVAVIAVVQQVDGNLIYPLVVGRTVELHPVAILLTVATGVVVGGIIGAFVAVPLAAVIASAVPAARRA